jgi:hypothetical protein
MHVGIDDLASQRHSARMLKIFWVNRPNPVEILDKQVARQLVDVLELDLIRHDKLTVELLHAQLSNFTLAQLFHRFLRLSA